MNSKNSLISWEIKHKLVLLVNSGTNLPLLQKIFELKGQKYANYKIYALINYSRPRAWLKKFRWEKQKIFSLSEKKKDKERHKVLLQY